MKTKVVQNIPNMFTSLNASCGIIAIIFTRFHTDSKAINIGCLLILCGGIFDTLDGLCARKLNLMTPLGKELDSFADFLTFGIAPICIFLTLRANLSQISLIEILISTFYIVCAMYRLARYNISEFDGHFRGLPTTATGVIMSAHIYLSNTIIDVVKYNNIHEFYSFALILVLGFAMISTIKVKHI